MILNAGVSGMVESTEDDPDGTEKTVTAISPCPFYLVEISPRSFREISPADSCGRGSSVRACDAMQTNAFEERMSFQKKKISKSNGESPAD